MIKKGIGQTRTHQHHKTMEEFTMSISSIQGLGSMQAMGQMQKPQPLTSEQKTKLQDILSQYDPENVTAEDAKKIFSSLREAGIRGPELKEAVEKAGFDSDELFKLGHDGKQPPQGMPPMGGAQSSDSVNLSALKSLQSILNQFDLSSIDDDQQSELMSQLEQSGLMRSGSVLDISA
jgi:hypothetical protein